MNKQHFMMLTDIVILAAGGSTRLGKSKQLLQINNQTLVYRIAKTACDLLPQYPQLHIHMITGKDHLQVEEAVSSLSVQCYLNQHWQKGMGSSIYCAMNVLSDNSNAVLFLSCDQVLLGLTDIQKLIDSWINKPDKIVAGSYENTRGIPVIFPKSYYSELIELAPEQGAKPILNKYHKKVISVEMPNARQDLDTPEDELKIRSLLE